MVKGRIPRIPYKCLNCRDRNYLIQCNCGCDEHLFLRDRHSMIRNFIKFHNCRNQPSGINAINYKNGRKLGSKKYWFILVKGYFSANKRGYIQEHIYNFQEYHKCCVLPWTDIHHIDGNKSNNMPWNLQGMMKSDHSKLTCSGRKYRLWSRIDTSDRRCHICKSDKTRIVPAKPNRSAQAIWQHLPWDKINWYCKRCHNREYKRYKRKMKLNLLHPQI